MKRIVITSVLGFSLALLPGCGSKKSGTLVIGVSLPTQREEIWVKGKEAMVEEAKRQGVELRIALADANAGEQASQVENLLSQKLDALILAPVDSGAASTLVEKAHAENVPVISYARLVLNSPVDYYITFDNEKVGELQGQFLLDKVGKGNIVVMAGAPTDNIAGVFKQGAMKVLAPAAARGDLKIVAEQAVDNWLPENALKITENALTQNRNNIKGILAPNDGTAGGAIQALAAQGLVGKVVVTGQDAEAAAIQRIRKGEQSMTVFKDIRELSKAAVQAAIAYARKQQGTLPKDAALNNGSKDVPTRYIPPTIITKENAEEVLVKSGYLTAEQFAGN